MSDSDSEDVIWTLSESLFTITSDLDRSESTTSFSSISSEDSTEKRRKRSKIQLYVEKFVRAYDDADFKAHFRLSRETAYSLIDRLEQSNFLPKHQFGQEKISERALLLTVWYLANKNTYREVADRFGMTSSCAHGTLKKVLEFIISLRNEVILWPNNQRRTLIKQAFAKDNGITGVVGAIDGSPIEITKPKENQDSYINRKGYHSILLQGVVDHERKFIDVFCGEPGSLHDARLLRRSRLFQKIDEDPNYIGDDFLLGDSAYPNLSWIVTPFKDNGFLTEQQITFNRRLCSKRVIVENTFGLLKGRFRRLKSLDNLDLMLCSKILLADCILHNICLGNERNNLEDIDEIGEEQPQNDNNADIEAHEGQTKRLQVFNEMFGL